jgi:hypothetical protein
VGPADRDAVIVSVDFFRPEPDPGMDPSMFPTHWCDYEIRYDGEVIHAYKASGMDSINALLRAMADATCRFDGQYFNAIDGTKKYSDVIPYMSSIIKEWFDDMRFAEVDPTQITKMEGDT